MLVVECFEDWSEFCTAVECHYGLTRNACLQAFFDMSPEEEESTTEFIRPVEEMRVCYGIRKEET